MTNGKCNSKTQILNQSGTSNDVSSILYIKKLLYYIDNNVDDDL